MKKIAFLIVILFFALALVTCDKKIERAIPAVPYCNMNDTNSIVRTNATSTTLNVRKVLLEDYTGHFCGNCPRAARKAESLVATYGNKLIIMANHVTPTYAAPQSDTLCREEFRNDASTEWDNAMGISLAPGLPRGAINRISSSPGSYALGEGAWEGTITQALGQPQSAKLVIRSYYDSIRYQLKVKVKTTFLQAFSGDVSLIVALTQDSIIGDQKDYNLPAGVAVKDGDIRPDYKFEHLVIGSANGTWGQLVKSAPAVNDTATVITPCYNLSKCFYKSNVCVNDKFVNVVAFVYRNDTKEVLQVEKIRIR